MSTTRSAAVRRKLTIVWAVALVASIAAGPVITNGSAFGNEEPTETPTVEAEAATGGDSTGTVTTSSDGATASGTTETTPTISDGYAFTFTFLHTDGTTSVLSGTSESNVGFLPSAGGATIPGTGMNVHVSCSDDYPDGWGEKDGPVEGVDTEWRVQSYVVDKYKDGEVDKSCGDTIVIGPEAATTDWSNEDWSEYTFEFGDGTIITGSNRSDGDGYTGDKNEADLGLSENVHVSCSDDFNLDKTNPAENGWGDKGAPVFGIDPSPVVSYSIDKYKDGEWDKTCADSTILIPTDPLPELSIDLEKLVKVDGGSFVDADSAPGPDAVFGSDVFFRFDVTNTGEVDLGGLKLTDSDYSTASCDLGSSLAPGASASCEIGPLPATFGLHTNVATVEAFAGAGDPHVYDGNKHHFTLAFADGSVITGSSESNEAEVGLSDTIHVSCSDDFGFEDPYDDKPDGWGEKGAPVLGVDSSPLVGYFITKFKDDGSIDQTCGVSVTDSDPANYTGVGVDTGTPGIDVEKLLSVDGGPWMDVDDAPGPDVVASSDVSFRFEVTNTGDEDLVGLTLSDTDFDIPASEVPSDLAVGGSFAVEIGPFGAMFGEHVNVATVEAVGAGGIQPHTYDGVKIHYTFILADGSVLSGSTTGDGPVGFPSGEDVHFSCSDDFGLDDDDPTNDGYSDGDKAPVQGIDPPITEFLMTHFNSDGSISKTCGYFEPPVTDSDPAHYTGTAGPTTTPDIDVEKLLSVDGGPWMDVDDAPGPDVNNSSSVSFQFVVTNTGDEDLTDLTLTDTDFTIPAAQVPNDLAVGGSFTVEIGPFDPIIGEHMNIATVEAYGVDDIQPHTYDGKKTSYTFLFADGSRIDGSTDEGDDTIGLPSNEKVHFSCSDDFGFDDDDPTNDGWSDGRAPVQGIDPPISEYLITKYESDGTVKKTCGFQNPPVTDSDPAHYTGLAPQPGIALEKYVSVDGGATWDPADVVTGPEAIVGDDVFFRFEVTNVGEVTLTDLTLTDDVFSVPTGPIPSSLAPGASYEIVIGPFAAEIGQHKNTATATGTGGGAEGHSDPGNDDYVFTFLLADGTLIEGTSDNNEAEVGLSDTIHVSCSDDFGFEDPNDDKPDGWGEKGAPVFGVDPGPIVSYQITKFRSDGTIYKTCGEGDPFTGTTLTVTDPAHYIGLELGSIGDRVWFDTNQNGSQDSGELGIPEVRVTLHDALLAPITSTTTDASGKYLFDDLRPGAYHVSFELPTGFVFSPQDAAKDDIDSDADTATGVTATIDLGPAEDDPTWDAGMYLLEPAIDIEKLTNGVQSDSGPGELIQAGSTVTWTYIVTNTGNTTLYDVVVTDSVEGFVCEFASLAPGAIEKCELVGEAQEGAYGNLSDVIGTDVLGTTVTDEDPSHYIGYSVGIDLEKWVQGRDADVPTGPYAEAGDPIRFTFIVHNTGSLDLADVSVTDDVFGDVCSIDLLEVGIVRTCEIDVPADLGQHKNIATVKGQPVIPGGAPIGNPVTDTDPAHYIGWVGAIDIEKSTNGEDADFGPGPFIPVGGDVEWIYVVTNNSSVDLVDVTVTDDEIGQVCVIDFLAANGGTDTCTAQGTAILGQYDNIGLVEGIPIDPAGNRLTNIPVTDNDPSHYVGYVTGIEIIKKVEGDDANSPTGPSLLVGTQALFTFDVTNTGSVALVDVAVTDDVYGDICVIGDLAPGATVQCELLVTVEQGQHTNVATAEGQPVDSAGNPLGGPVEDDDPANYFGAAPSIAIEKATNGLDSDDAPGAFILEGTPIEWTYVITNDGNVDLDNVVVTDNQGLVPVIVDQGDGDDILAIGEVWVYAASGTAEIGEYANLGSVLARDPDGVLVGDNDPSHYTGYSAALRLVKKVEGEDANTPTGPFIDLSPGADDFVLVTFTFEVFNEGSADLVNIVVDDDVLGPAVCEFDLIAADSSATCSLTVDAEEGQHTNNATATGQPVDPAGNPLGGPLSDDDPANYFGWLSDIDLEKLTNGVDSDNAPGEFIVAGTTVIWTYEVTNNGNVDLANVLVEDDQEGIICLIDLLPAGLSDECSAQGTAQPGQYANVADVAGTPVYNGTVLGADETDVDPSHYFGTDPAIDISKNAEGEDSQTIEVRSSVTFTIRVENTGNVPLTDVTVTDVEVLACEATYTDNGGVLDVGAIWTYECTVDDVQEGFVNIAVVDGTGPAGKTVTDEDPSTVIVEAPGIDIVKGTRAGGIAGLPPGAVISGPPVDPGTDGSFIAAGLDLTWVYVVTNTGDADLVNVVVSDDLEGFVCEIPLLQVGSTVHCLLGGVAGLNEYDNVGTADGETASGFAVTDSDPSSYFGADPSIDLEKSTNGLDSDAAPGEFIPEGAPVLWLYEVENTGNTDLVDVTIVDDLEGEICVIPLLPAGGFDVCVAEGTAQLGQYANEGSVIGTPVDESLTPIADAVSDSDPSHYTGFTVGIDVEKWVEGVDADVAPGPYVDLRPPSGSGDGFVEVTFEFVVTNTGSLDLANVVVTDDFFTQYLCEIPLLDAGETFTCDSLTVPAEEGQHTNTATAVGQPVTPAGVPIGIPIFDDDPANYYGALPAISLEKFTNGLDSDEAPGEFIPVGGPVLWLYEVENTGNVDLVDVAVTDDLEGPVCVIASLPVGETDSCTKSDLDGAGLGLYANVGTAVGFPVDDLGVIFTGPVSDDDPSHYTGFTVGIDVEKYVDGVDADTAPGVYVELAPSNADFPTQVTFTITVTNTGTVDLIDVVVTDDVFTDLVCTFPLVAAGETVACDPFTVDAVEGQHTNTATVEGMPVDADGTALLEDPIFDDDPANYFGWSARIDVEKSTNGLDSDAAPGEFIPVGGPVLWTYVVSNNGNVDLFDVTITDDIEGLICTFDVLAAGTSETCTLVADGGAELGLYANEATATGQPTAPAGDLLGGPISDSDPSHYTGFTVGIDVEKWVEGVDADVAPGPYVDLRPPSGSGDGFVEVTFEFVVTNTGSLDLANVVVTDDFFTQYLCEIPLLDAGETFTCDSLTVPAEEGQHTNTATAVGQPVTPAGVPIGIPIFDDDPANYYGALPAISLEKFTNGLDSDEAPGEFIPVGGPVLWLYEVENTGNVDLVDVAVTDDLEGPVCVIASLPVGETDSCTKSDLDGAGLGLYANVGTAVGFPVDDLGVIFTGPVSDDDPSHYTGFTVGIDVEKYVDGVDADTAPGVYVELAPSNADFPTQVTFTITVTNTGTVDLIDVVVTDDVFTDLVCTFPLVAAGETVACDPFTVDAVEGQHTNTATVEGMPVDADGTALLEDPIFDDDPANYFGWSARIDVEKSTNGLDSDAAPGEFIPVGGPVLWTYVVSNNGNVDLFDVTITDDIEGLICTFDVLAAGTSETCTLVADGGAELGLYANEATATGQPTAPAGDLLGGPISDSDPSHYTGFTVGIDVEKWVEGVDADVAPGPYVDLRPPSGSGDGFVEVTFEFVVTNTGSLDLANVVVTDDFFTQYLCEIPLLDAGETFTCDSLTVPAEEGQHTNTATAVGQPVTPAGVPIGIPIFDDDPANYYGALPAISLEKFTNGLDSDEAPGEFIPVGGPVLWLYEVENTGNVDLVDVAVTDDLEGPVCVIASLPVGETDSCTKSDLDGAGLGLYANVGTAVGFPVDDLGVIFTGPVSDDDPSHYTGFTVGIDVEKYVDGVDADTAPGVYVELAPSNADFPTQVTFTITVTNTGTVDLIDVVVTDDVFTDLVCTFPLVAAGETVACDPFTVDAVEGQHTNTATVEGMPVDADGTALLEDPIFDDDPANYFGWSARIDVEKSTNGLDSDAAPGEFIPVGGPVLWTYVVSNNGNVDLFDVTITDDIEGLICTFDVLAAGTSETCTLVADGGAELGLYANEATATGQPTAPAGDLLGGPISDSDPSHYTGFTVGIDVEKWVEGVDADVAPGPYVDLRPPSGSGDGFVEVTFEFVVTNTGSLDLANVVVTDDFFTQYLCEIPLLDAGETFTCDSLTVPAEEGQHTNTATAVGQPVTPAGVPIGIPIFDDDPANYYGALPAISLEKFTNGLDSDEAPGEFIPVGGPVLWLYEVENTGNVDLVDVAVTDDLEGPVCVIASLPVGETDSCTKSDLDGAGLGLYANVGTAVGFPVDDLGVIFTGPVSDDDPSHYTGFTVGIDVEKYVDGVDADTAPGVYVELAPSNADFPTQVTFTITVTNTGTVDLIDVVVTDDVFTDLVCTFPLVAAGETVACDPFTVDAVEGQHTNTATVEGMPVDADGTALLEDPIFDDDPANYFGWSARIDVEKSTNGLDSDAAPGEFIPVGGPVLWTYVVSNNGNVDLFDVTITDDIEGLICTFDVLAAGTSETCTLASIAQLGQYANVATAEGQPVSPYGDDLGGPISDVDPSHYTGFTVGIELEKFVNGDPADSAPGPYVDLRPPSGSDEFVEVTFTFVVTNTGSLDLENVTVTDDTFGQFSCLIPLILAGESAECDPWTVPAEEGQHTNTATADGQPVTPAGVPIGIPIFDDDPANYFGGNAAITIEKETLTQMPVEQDVDVVFEIVVTNVGNVPLTDVTVADLLAPACAAVYTDNGGVFDIGATWVYECNAGPATADYTNVASVVGTPPEGPPVEDDDDAPVTVIPLLVIGDFVWHDFNHDGIQNDGEQSALEGVTVRLLNAGGAMLQETLTGANGDYQFGVLPGTYIIEVLSPAGTQVTLQNVGDDTLDSDIDPTTGRTGMLSITTDDLTIDAGFYIPVEIGDFIWRDRGAAPNGLQDGGEPGIEGVTVQLLDDGGAVIDTDVTDEFGAYGFTIDPGTYSLQVVAPSDATFTAQFAGDVALDSNADAAGAIAPFTVTSGQDDLTLDAGLVIPIDLEIAKEAFPEPTPPGSIFTYQVRVQNLGPADAQDVVILDLLPSRCQPGNPQDPGLVLIPPSPIWPDCPHNVGDAPWPAPFERFPIFTETTDSVGDPDFRIDASEPTDDERSPFNEASFVSATAPAGVSCTYDAAVHGVRCDVGDLAAGASVVVDINLELGPFALVRVWNRGYTFADDVETNVDRNDEQSLCATLPGEDALAAGLGCNYVKKNETITAAIDLAIAKTVDKDTAVRGDTLTYTVTATNNGPSGTLLASIVDSLPEGVSFVEAAGCDYDAASHTVSCGVANWLPDESKTFTIVVTVDDDAIGTQVNTVTVSQEDPRDGAPLDENPDNDTASAQTVLVELEVLDDTVTTTTAGETLPRTGADTGGLAIIGFLLVAGGALALVALRRRDDEEIG